MSIRYDLNIAEIPYEGGSVRFRYSRFLSDDGLRWIRHGMFVAYAEDGAILSEGSTSMGKSKVFGATIIRMDNLPAKEHMRTGVNMGNGDIGMPQVSRSHRSHLLMAKRAANSSVESAWLDTARGSLFYFVAAIRSRQHSAV